MYRVRSRQEESRATSIEPLGALDSVFLAVENHTNPMNIGSVGIFEGGAPSLEEARDIISNRIDLVPRCRQRLRSPRIPLARRVWIDDVSFDIGHHVVGISLPNRSPETLERVVAELAAIRLDRERPLWKVWVVDGVDDETWAMIAIVHHCMVDGITGNDLLGAMLSANSRTEKLASSVWKPSPEPTGLAVLRFTVTSSIGTLISRLRAVIAALGHPLDRLHRVARIAGAAKSLWYRRKHRTSSLIGEIGSDRTWMHFDISLVDIRSIQNSLGGTINDVVLAAVSLGFHNLLIERGEDVHDRFVTALVPVSLHHHDEYHETGNRVANVHAQLPVHMKDPRTVLRTIHSHLEELKRSHQVEATGLLMRIGDYVPRFAADRIARAVFLRQRNVETAITNVPGSHEPLHFGPHRMIAAFPVAPIGGLVRITVAVWSYCDRLHFGVTADRSSTPDLDRLVNGISTGFEALIADSRAAASGSMSEPKHMWRTGPAGLRTEQFVLEPLGPKHNRSDYAAWSTSIDHIRATPGFRADLWDGDEWPYPMSLEQNSADLAQHDQEFRDGEAFAYTVLDPDSGDVIGCVYIDPDDVADAKCRLWVRADRRSLDGDLERAVRSWLSGPDWQLDSVRFPGRD